MNKLQVLGMKYLNTGVKILYSSTENNLCTPERPYSDTRAPHSVPGACEPRRLGPLKSNRRTSGANPDG